MGKIKKILENELIGGTQSTDVYPVTSIKAIYDENNERLDNIIDRKDNKIKAELENEVARLDEKIDDKTSEINVAKEEALQAIAENEQSAITNFNSQRVTPEMLSESTKQLIEASGGGTITNLADDEDITSVDNGTGSNILKFANRTYNPDNFSGKGYKILRKNMVDSKNILTQEMINEPNTIYEIRYNFDLNEQEINISEGCELYFNGGSFNNGHINNDLSLKVYNNLDNSIFNNCINFYDNIELKATNIGFIPNNSDYAIFNGNKFIELLNTNKNITINLENSEFYISYNTDVININNNLQIKNGTIIINNFKLLPFKKLEFYNVNITSNDFIIYGNNINHIIDSIIFDSCVINSKIAYLKFSKIDNTIEKSVGINKININNCKIYSTGTEFEILGGSVFEEFNISNNIIKDITTPFLFMNRLEEDITDIDINNAYINTDIIISNNYFKGKSNIKVNWYSCSVFVYSKTCYFLNNIIEDINNVIDTNTSICTSYDVYLSCNEVYFKNNIIKNCIGWRETEEGEKPNTEWFKSKSIVKDNEYSVRTFENNQYIINENYLINKGCNINDLYSRLFDFTHHIDIVNINNNIFQTDGDYFYLQGKSYSVSTKEINVIGNIFNIQIKENYLIGTNDTYSGNITISNNQFNKGFTNLFYVNKSSENTIYSNVKVINNYFDKAYYFETISPGKIKDIIIKNNTYGYYNNSEMAIIQLQNVKNVDIEIPQLNELTTKGCNIYLPTNGIGNLKGSLIKPTQNIYFYFSSINTYIKLDIKAKINENYILETFYLLYNDDKTITYWKSDGNESITDGGQKSIYIYENLRISIQNINKYISILGSASVDEVQYNVQLIPIENINIETVFIKNSGVFINKPETPSIGFAYFCTDKQTTEGSTNGIMIYHKGGGVWVDALGRIVS